ncbi:MAG: asparagine synthase (glutamine-hydrolyzing) [Rhodospirillaceae bacterium]|nr:asparagine synthase (glutamine-hydrolyzing) [Rhodospirillaceae bacterium]
MCGIAGIFAYDSSAPPVDRDALLRMSNSMISRGPDGEGNWVSENLRTGFAHRRLSIIDLSDSGAQPMQMDGGRLMITYNGEIYNFRELRAELEQQGRRFRSESDTEVLLHLYDRDGAAMVERLRGMFAFAIHDCKKQAVFLARDGFGIKPLYYANDGRTLRFASQVKALLAGGDIDTAPSAAGLAGIYVWGSVPEPWTLFDNIRSLPAGSTMWVDATGAGEPVKFFDVTHELERASETPEQWSWENLRNALLDTLQHHLVADVPVGAFLSAGLDSATIVALAAELQPNALRSVTLAFEEFDNTEFDEAALAEKIASHYDTSHRTERLKGADFHAEYRRLCSAMDQPTIDGVNTYFVSKVAAETGLKVAMSGLGGDEMFGGYPSFRQIPQLAETLGKIPGMRCAGQLFRKIFGPTISAVKSPKYAGLFEYGTTYADVYLLRRALFMPWELPNLMGSTMARDGWEELEEITGRRQQVDSLHTPRTKVSALEATWYMRHQLLRDSDWAGMAHSLEIRVPLVDTVLFRRIAPMLVSKTPPGKRDMAASPTKPLPDTVLNRSKTGFAVPMPDWLLKNDPAALKQGYRGWLRKIIEDCYA